MSCAESGITCLASAMEGVRKLLCVASNDCTICVRDAITGLLIHMLEGHTKTPLCLCVVNHIVYSGGTDKSVQVYNLNVSVSVLCIYGYYRKSPIINRTRLVVGPDFLAKFREFLSHVSFLENRVYW